MNAILFSLMLLFWMNGSAFGQQHQCNDCVEWREGEKLTWSDFKGAAKKASRNEAMTDSGMSISLKCDGQHSEVIVKCYFDRTKSWTKSRNSEYLLAHEQLHFDITELFVRKLRKQLTTLGNDCKLLSEHVEHFYQSNYREYVAYQDAYDEETQHSLNKEAQLRWEKKIDQELRELLEFASRPDLYGQTN